MRWIESTMEVDSMFNWSCIVIIEAPSWQVFARWCGPMTKTKMIPRHCCVFGQTRNAKAKKKSRIVAEYMGNSRCQFHVRHSYTQYALLLCAAQFLLLSWLMKSKARSMMVAALASLNAAKNFDWLCSLAYHVWTCTHLWIQTRIQTFSINPD